MVLPAELQGHTLLLHGPLPTPMDAPTPGRLQCRETRFYADSQAEGPTGAPHWARVIFDECSNMIVLVAFSVKIAAITH